MLDCLLRRSWVAASLVADHPPVLRHLHKRLVHDLACPPGARHAGRIELSRWWATLPSVRALGDTVEHAEPGTYDYAGADAGVWHVNFADPHLFVAYGSGLLAQDELQAAEHPALGSVREALLTDGQPALTEDDLRPTPVLVAGVERRCAIATAPDAAAGRPLGLYGNRFAAAPVDMVRSAVRVIAAPTRTNLIAMAAPGGGIGRYSPDQIERVLAAAYTGFAAAVEETARLWPDTPVEVRTGFWGCGAFGGNRTLMTLLQLLAARLARVDRLRFYVFDDDGRARFDAGRRQLAEVLDAGAAGEPLAVVIGRIAQCGHAWGVSDGN